MKKHFKSLLTVVFLMSAVIVLNSCSDDEVPANQIEDATGINVSLKWTTDGSTSDAISLDDADIDLYLYHDQDELDWSTSGSQFENVTLDEVTTTMADGTYVVKVRFYDLYENGNYTVKISGKNSSVTKTWSFDRDFTMDQENTSVKVGVLEIKKAGNKFTMTEIN